MTVAADSVDDVKRSRDQVDGEKVRALQAALGLTIRALADRLGVEQRTVARWRAGKIDRLTWVGVLATLGLTADWEPPVPPEADTGPEGDD